MKALALLTVLLVACGAEQENDKAEAELAEPSADDGQSARYDDDLAITVVKDLPFCELTNNGQVVYSSSLKLFKICDASTGSWYDLDLTGPKGEPGKDGVNGEDGEDSDVAGPVGPQGPAGLPGQDGKDGQIVADNMWYDPVVGQWWLKGMASATWDDAVITCDGDSWRLPSIVELHYAQLRGICNQGDNCPINVWSGDEGGAGTQAATINLNVSPASIDWRLKTLSFDVYCVEIIE
jgi:hypothetical protein